MVRQHLAQYGWTEYFKDIKLKKTDKIVDIGTGPGYFIDILVNYKFENIYGITYSEKEFEDNKDKPGVTMWCQDMSDMPFEDREIDFIRASDVLQCSVMPYITLLEFNRVLKKGGQVFIEVPLPHQPLKHEYIRTATNGAQIQSHCCKRSRNTGGSHYAVGTPESRLREFFYP